MLPDILRYLPLFSLWLLTVTPMTSSHDVILEATPLTDSRSDVTVVCSYQRDRGSNFSTLMTLALYRAEIRHAHFTVQNLAVDPPDDSYIEVASVTSSIRHTPEVTYSLGASVDGSYAVGGKTFISFTWSRFPDLAKGFYKCVAIGTNDNSDVIRAFGARVCHTPVVSEVTLRVSSDVISPTVSSTPQDSRHTGSTETLTDALNQQLTATPPSHIRDQEARLRQLTSDIMLVNTSKTLVDLEAQLVELRDRLDIQDEYLSHQTKHLTTWERQNKGDVTTLDIQRLRLTSMKVRVEYQRSVLHDQVTRKEHMAAYSRNYQLPTQTFESVARQRTMIASQQEYFIGERSRLLTQIQLVDKQRQHLDDLLHRLNTTSFSHSLASSAAALEKEIRDLRDEREYLEEQRALLVHGEFRIDYSEAMLDDSRKQTDSMERYLQRSSDPGWEQQGRAEVALQVEEIKVIRARLEFIITQIDINTAGLDTLTSRLAKSVNFDVQLLVDERVLLEEQKSTYLNHISMYEQRKSQLLQLLSTLPI